MKLTVPQLEIEEDEGFSPDKDIFNRKEFGDQLRNLVENTSDELVVALDAPWGEGKSTFVKMWRGQLSQSGIKSIYFNAFENDYHDSPFFAIAGELYELISKVGGKEKSNFKKKAVSVLGSVGRMGLRIGVKTASAGILDETIFESAGTDKDVSSEITTLLDSYVEKQLDSISKKKKNISDFREYLSELPIKLKTPEKPVVFIIDELDRCKPTFALELLENVKHLFSVPRVCFVLVMNRSQLEESVRSEYGSGVEAERYLQKFINLWAVLPKNTDIEYGDIKTYIKECISRMDLEVKTTSQQDAIDIFGELAIHYNFSFRDIEQALTNYAIIYNMSSGNLNLAYQAISIYLSIIKTIFPQVCKKLSSGNISYNELVELTELKSFESSWWGEEKEESHYLKWLLRYNLSTDEEASELVSKGNYSGDTYGSRGAVKSVLRWLNNFHRR